MKAYKQLLFVFFSSKDVFRGNVHNKVATDNVTLFFGPTHLVNRTSIVAIYT